ncbi:MAG TPA: YggS family pyridoxal phosphate-dependent enzyme [Planctomycetaceae bacterium]|nr:YggS family pyridoxal phosphate-dependent enzyme [Planctomycetaceae bacterium]
MTDRTRIIADNVARIRQRIGAAAARSGRPAEAVKLVAVTKYVGPEEVRPLVAAGCTTLGESRPQQLAVKAEALADSPIEWHLIGHLQRNKARLVAPLVAMIESIDSQRLLAAVDQAAADVGRRVPALLEVNISGESAKHGFTPSEVAPLVAVLDQYAHVEIRGLMAMASLGAGAEQTRAEFAALRTLRDEVQADCPEGVNLAELSMGMSGDFEIAIEEGATIVRIGSALFEGVEP